MPERILYSVGYCPYQWQRRASVPLNRGEIQINRRICAIYLPYAESLLVLEIQLLNLAVCRE